MTTRKMPWLAIEKYLTDTLKIRTNGVELNESDVSIKDEFPGYEKGEMIVCRFADKVQESAYHTQIFCLLSLYAEDAKTMTREQRSQMALTIRRADAADSKPQARRFCEDLVEETVDAKTDSKNTVWFALRSSTTKKHPFFFF